MLARMSSHTLAEWIAYSNLEPFGDALIDVHMARLTAMVEILRRPKETRLDLDRFRFWKEKSAEPWDPQKYFDGLKDAFQRLMK